MSGRPPAPRGGEELTTTGAYALAHHAMYGGGILIALGWREEAWLRERLPGYVGYQRQTPHKLRPSSRQQRIGAAPDGTALAP